MHITTEMQAGFGHSELSSDTLVIGEDTQKESPHESPSQVNGLIGVGSARVVTVDDPW